MVAVKKSSTMTSRLSAWRQAKMKSSSVTACRPATASIFAKPYQWATPTPATKSPATALIAWPKCVTSSEEAKSFLSVCKHLRERLGEQSVRRTCKLAGDPAANNLVNPKIMPLWQAVRQLTVWQL